MTRPDTKQIIEAIRTHQLNDISSFLKEWNLAKASWVNKLDASMHVLIDAYSEDLERLLRGEPTSREWAEMIECAQLLRVTTLDCFLRLKTGMTNLPLSEPQNLADRTYGFLMDAAYLFASSLGVLRKRFPAKSQILSEDVSNAL